MEGLVHPWALLQHHWRCACNNSLNAAEQRELNSRMEKKQMKEFMTVCSIA